MGQTAEDHALALESLLAAPSDERDFEKFHSYLSLKSRVVSFREPDAAHATLADLRYETVSTQCLTDETRFRRHSKRTLLKKPLARQGTVMIEQDFHLIRQRRILSAEAGQPDRAFLVCQVECLFQMRTERPPPIWVQCGHRCLKANPRKCSSGDRCAPSPTFFARCVPTSAAWKRSRRK